MSTDPQDLRQRSVQAIGEQPATTVTVLSSLLAVQDELGYLPQEALEEVASHTDHSVNDVWGVASFYPNFRFTTPGAHTLEVCWGPTCHLLGAQPLLQGVLAHLGLEGEGDTSDGSFTLKLNTCLGACPHGPLMSFDHELAGHMTLPQATRRMERLTAADATHDTNGGSTRRWDPAR